MGYTTKSYNNVVNCISRVARVKRLISTVGRLTSTGRRLKSLVILVITTISFIIVISFFLL